MSSAPERGWHGRYCKGAMREHRESKRLAARERDERTDPKRRSTKKRAKRARSNLAGEST